jgi:hypothetical protein
MITKDDLQSVADRTASAALHGSQQIRSGQLDPQIETQRDLVKQLVNEAGAAYQSWAHWAAINELVALADVKKKTDHFELYGIGSVRSALARDMIVSALRLSEPDKQEKVTLCGVAAWLQDDALCERLASEQWALDLGHKPFVAAAAAQRNAARLVRFKSCVTAKWPTNPGDPAPLNPEFMNLRADLRDLRDTRLAHLLTRAPKVDPLRDQVRRFLELTLELSTDIQIVITGSGLGAESVMECAREQSNKLWTRLLVEPATTYSEQTTRRNRMHGGFAEDP